MQPERLVVEATIVIDRDWWAEEAPLETPFNEWTEEDTKEFLIGLYFKTYDLFDSTMTFKMWTEDAEGNEGILKDE